MRHVSLLLVSRDEAQRFVKGLPLVFDLSGTEVHLMVDAARRVNGTAPKKSTNSLAAQRGDCPYCSSKGILIVPHVNAQHPGKPIPWLGAGGVKCPSCSRTFPSAKSLQTHAYSHRKKSPKKAKA